MGKLIKREMSHQKSLQLKLLHLISKFLKFYDTNITLPLFEILGKERIDFYKFLLKLLVVMFWLLHV